MIILKPRKQYLENKTFTLEEVLNCSIKLKGAPFGSQSLISSYSKRRKKRKYDYEGKNKSRKLFPLLSIIESEKILDHQHFKPRNSQILYKPTAAGMESLLFAGKYVFPFDTKLDNLTWLLQCYLIVHWITLRSSRLPVRSIPSNDSWHSTCWKLKHNKIKQHNENRSMLSL